MVNRNMAGRILLLLSIFVAVFGCGSKGSGGTSAADAPPPNGPADPWVLSTTDANNKTPALLWNGLIGIRLGRQGDGTGSDGKPLPFFMIDQYDTTGEEKIRVLPNPLVFQWSMAEPLLDPKTARNYSQKLDMRTGVLQTEWDDNDSVAGEWHVACETVISPTSRMIGIRWTVDKEPKDDLRTPFSDIPGTIGSSDPDPNHPDGVHRVYRGTFGDDVCRILALERKEKQVLHNNGGPELDRRVLERTISFGRSLNGQKMAMARMPADYDWAADYDKPEPPPTFDELKKQTADYWAKAWQTDIEIDGPVEDQQAVRSFLFYLRSSIHPEGQMGISPFGLSSDRYNGHVFWDADIWVFPALALIDPERSKAITRYRLATMQTARTNADSWIRAERPTAKGKLGGLAIFGMFFDLKFAWESSVTGEETASGDSRFEDHISGSVAFTLGQAKAIGLASASDADVLISGVEGFYRHRMEKQPDGTMSINGTMSPDEFHTGNNDLYTNLLADWIWRARRPANSPNLVKMKLPQDSTSFLTYDNDSLKGYKQAAAVLAIYPLQYPPAEKQAKVMMDRFADKVTENGPAMSDSLHALIWARLGEADKAYQTWRKSWQRYTDYPLMLFSEKPNTEATYFTTGAAGCLQTVLYGFLGIRIDSKEEAGAAWTKPLLGGRILSVKPHLPKEWKRVTLRNFTVLGKRYTLTADHQSVRVTPGD